MSAVVRGSCHAETGVPLGERTRTMFWFPVLGYEGLYEVAEDGRVRSLPRPSTDGRILRPAFSGKYLGVALCKDGKQKTRLVHQLVAEAFLGPRPKGLDVCHKDGNKFNLHYTNLKYDTRSNNIKQQVEHGTHNRASRICCPNCGSDFDVDSRGRFCPVCRKAQGRASSIRYYQHHREAILDKKYPGRKPYKKGDPS